MGEHAKPVHATAHGPKTRIRLKSLFEDWSAGDRISSAIAGIALIVSAGAAFYTYEQAERAESFTASDYLLTRYDSAEMHDARIVLRWYDGYLRKLTWPKTEPPDVRIQRTEKYYRNYLYNEPGLDKSFDVQAPLPEDPAEFFKRLDRGRRVVKDFYEGYRVLSESGIVSTDVRRILKQRALGNASSILFEYWLPVEIAQNRASYGKDSLERDNQAVCLAWYFRLLSGRGPEGARASEIEDWLPRQPWVTNRAEIASVGFAELPKDQYRVGRGCQQTRK
jgi:hypothetical protein